MENTYIIDAVRTPRSKRKGKFSSVHPADLYTYPLREITARNEIAPELIEDVLTGCVTQTGEQGWCIARTAVLAAGFPYSVPATTINRLCGSGQQAVNFAAGSLASGQYSLVIAGGLEHMTRCPMFSDGGGEESSFLKKYHPDLVQQGPACEILASEFKVTRDDADAFALTSQMNAKRALDENRFAKSIVPVAYKDESGAEQQCTRDDNPRPETTLQTLGNLKVVFQENGILTAGNSSAIVDGAAAVLMANESTAKKMNLKPRARIVASAVIGSPPKIMLTGPIEASRLVLKKAGLKTDDIDLWEINEAFAPVTIVTMRELQIDPQKVNVNGGGIALGHPLGATGAMLINTAVDELERTNKRYALVTMCIGLGMGIGTILERV